MNDTTKAGGPEQGLGERLRQVREDQHITQRELASRTGINQNQLSGYENQAAQPSPLQLRRLCDALAVSPTWLLYGSENVHRRESLVDELLASGGRDELPAQRVATCFLCMGLDDQRTVATLVLRLLEAEHGRDTVRRIMGVADEMAASVQRDPGFLDAVERAASDVAERQTDWVGNTGDEGNTDP